MDQFLRSLPKPLIAVVVIAIGFIVIVMNDPPHTVCDSQMERFRDQERDALYEKKGAGGVVKQPMMKSLFDTCQADNSPGGCFEFFSRIKKMNVDINNIPRQCAEAAASDASLLLWVRKSLTLIGQIAWGAKGPSSTGGRNGWFDSSDLAMFCELKNQSIWMTGRESYEQWRGKVLSELPGAEKMSPDQVYSKSVYSINCANFR